MTAAMYKGPMTLVVTLSILESGSAGLMSPKPTVVRHENAK